MSLKEFYTRLRAGEPLPPQLSAWVPGNRLWRRNQKGNDLLLIIFSSALSSTCDNARMAAEELKERYLSAKLVVDSFANPWAWACWPEWPLSGEAEGRTIEENAALLEGIKLKVHHWFTG